MNLLRGKVLEGGYYKMGVNEKRMYLLKNERGLASIGYIPNCVSVTRRERRRKGVRGRGR